MNFSDYSILSSFVIGRSLLRIEREFRVDIGWNYSSDIKIEPEGPMTTPSASGCRRPSKNDDFV